MNNEIESPWDIICDNWFYRHHFLATGRLEECSEGDCECFSRPVTRPWESRMEPTNWEVYMKRVKIDDQSLLREAKKLNRRGAWYG